MRIRFDDADRIRTRVQDAAVELGLNGARGNVLGAVLKLLCRWSRLADDRVRMHHLEDLLAESGKRHDRKTIGRALTSLADAELLTYVAARGRGRHATIAIHPRFCRDVDELCRDHETGRVVTFSSPPSSSLSKEQTSHPAPNSPETQVRPTGVGFRRSDLDRVLKNLPPEMRTLPHHLRWLLGGKIIGLLRRGFLPAQILDVLGAPLPEHVTHPYRLAVFRLSRNMIGPGPRLAERQRNWDTQARAAEQSARRRGDQFFDAETDEAGLPDLQDRLLVALRNKLRRTLRSNETIDDLLSQMTARLTCDSNESAQAVLARHAARLSRREHPDLPLDRALAAWIARWAPETSLAERESCSNPKTGNTAA